MTAPVCGKCGKPDNSLVHHGKRFNKLYDHPFTPASGGRIEVPCPCGCVIPMGYINAPPQPEDGICEFCGVDYGDNESLASHTKKGCDCAPPPEENRCPHGVWLGDRCLTCDPPAPAAAGERETIHLWGDQFFYCDEGWGKTCHDEARGDCLSVEDAKWLIELIRRVRP